MSTPSAQSQEQLPVSMTGVGVRSLRDERTIVLDGINWEVRAGECWILAGLQGSGKTDFLMTLAGLIGPARGRYELFGEEMPIFDEARMPTRLRLGLVFETGQLFNHLSIAENISLPIRYHRNLSKSEAHAETEELLELVGLSPFAETTPGGLSRNWQKRAALARALALRPELLLVDSPLGGLDPRHMNWWLGFLHSLSRGHPWLGRRPMTLVLTSADLRPWRGGERKFAAMQEGRFEVVGLWEDIEKHPFGFLKEFFQDHAPEGDRV